MCAAMDGAAARNCATSESRPSRGEPRLELRAQRGVAAGVLERNVAGDRAHVEPGTTDQQRHAAASRDPVECLERVAPEIGGGERLVGVDEIEAVVGNALAVRRSHLGRAEVHAAVHLARVGADDLCTRDRRGELE